MHWLQDMARFAVRRSSRALLRAAASCAGRSTRGGYRSHPREMIAEIRDNGQLDWSYFFRG